MTWNSTVSLPDFNISFSNDKALTVIAGVNVLESEEVVWEVAQHCKKVTSALGVSWVFKASFDKANRSSVHSFRGPGMAHGVHMLESLKRELNVPVITDIHEPHQAQPVAEVADIVQIPAFLARQTDLIQAAAETNKPLLIKKPQFSSPDQMKHVLTKVLHFGNNNIMLGERGSSFGYHQIVVDMLGMDTMKGFQCPIVFDVTHALQLPGDKDGQTGGRSNQKFALARSGVAIGIAGLFVEMHPDPSVAKCDAKSALNMVDFEPFLKQVLAIDHLIKDKENK